MRSAAAIDPNYTTVTQMLAAEEQSGVRLFFVNRKEEDRETPMARIRNRALLAAMPRAVDASLVLTDERIRRIFEQSRGQYRNKVVRNLKERELDVAGAPVAQERR